MKTSRIPLTVLLGLAAAAGMHAADPKPASRTEVTYVQPEKFTDAADDQRGSTFGLEGNLAELREHIERRADAALPAGYRLSVTITDIDLAGEIEPWRSASLRDVRIIKSIYSPRIDLEYKVLDASGAVVKEGKRELRDMTFDMNILPNRSDRRVYEKELLDSWIRSDFREFKKQK